MQEILVSSIRHFMECAETTGDCTITMCCDFQDPVEMSPSLKEWENGYKIVSAIKSSSKENGFIYFLRTIYYKMIRKMSDVEMIEHFTGFGLYDKSFIELFRNNWMIRFLLLEELWLIWL